MPALGSFWLKAGVLETFDKSDLSLWRWTLMDLVIHTGSEVESSDGYYLEVIFAVLVVAITLVWRRGCLSEEEKWWKSTAAPLSSSAEPMETMGRPLKARKFNV